MSGSKEPKPAARHTAKRNSDVARELPFTDERDFEDARRGFMGTLDQLKVTSDRGRVTYSLEDYGFLSEIQPPDTVNPSLWRIARLNMNHGLFKVLDRVYQVRGFDLANMTIVEGDSGLVILDTMTTVESSRAGLALYFQHRPRRPVVAVVYSHSHADHYGGVRGLVTQEDVQAGKVRIIAPDRFIEEVSSENVIAGLPMVRRAQYQFGGTLPKGPRGQVDAAVGKISARGTLSLIPPTMIITKPVETHVIDGVEMTFHLTPDTEAPADMNVYMPGLKPSIWQTMRCSVSTTSIRCGAPKCVMPMPGRNTWTRPVTVSAAAPKQPATGTTGRSGAPNASTTILPSTATCSSTCTTRP
ncbi:MAG: MBL fold metallo-hydrolase [Hyphomicrobiaceae bacterium]